MKFKLFLISLVVMLIAAFLWQNSKQKKTKSMGDKTYTIGIIQVIEHPALDQTRFGIIDELKERGYTENKNSHIHYESAQGNPALAAQIVQKFIGQKVNVIIAIGTTVAQTAKQLTKDSKIPVVFASVSDPMSAKLIDALDVPGKNVTGVSNYISISKQFHFFKKLLPHFKHLGIVYNPGESNSVIMIDKMNEVSDVFDITLHTSPATKTSEVMAATQTLIKKAEVIFINNDNTALSAFDAVVKVASEHDIPVFVSDVDCLDKGALAVLGPDQYELGKQAATIAHRILSEEPPATIPVEMPKKIYTKMNVAVAEKLGIAYINDSVKLFED
jgi:putative ABC transport system substrate-binding protein